MTLLSYSLLPPVLLASPGMNASHVLASLSLLPPSPAAVVVELLHWNGRLSGTASSQFGSRRRLALHLHVVIQCGGWIQARHGTAKRLVLRRPRSYACYVMPSSVAACTDTASDKFYPLGLQPRCVRLRTQTECISSSCHLRPSAGRKYDRMTVPATTTLAPRK